MNDDALRARVLGILGEIAPEAALDALPDDAPLREELDLDSLNFQSFVIGLSETLGVDVPERDYGKLDTLRATLDYLAAHGATV